MPSAVIHGVCNNMAYIIAIIGFFLILRQSAHREMRRWDEKPKGDESMKTYIVESILTPIEIVYANNENEALDQYAKKQSFNDAQDLINICEKECGMLINVNNCIDVERIN